MRRARIPAALAALLFAALGWGERDKSTSKVGKKAPAAISYEAIDALERGDETKVGKILDDSPAMADARDEEGKTLLYHAALHGKNETVKHLLDGGADPNTPDEKGFTPLYWAAASGHRDIAKLLLDKGADPNAKTKTDGLTPLHAAANHLKGLSKHAGCLEVVKLLIAKGADPNAKAKHDETPLHIAAQRGHKDIAELLLAAKADPNARAELYGETPLHRAAVYDQRDVAELLLAHGADINAKDKHERTPLVRAKHMRHQELAAFLVEKGGTE